MFDRFQTGSLALCRRHTVFFCRVDWCLCAASAERPCTGKLGIDNAPNSLTRQSPVDPRRVVFLLQMTGACVRPLRNALALETLAPISLLSRLVLVCGL